MNIELTFMDTNPRLPVTTPNVLSLSSKFLIIATSWKHLNINEITWYKHPIIPKAKGVKNFYFDNCNLNKTQTPTEYLIQ